MGTGGIKAMQAVIQAELERDVQFQPGPYYEPDGDCIFFFRAEAVTKAVRANDWVTVHYDLDTGKVAGVQLKHFHRVLDLIREKVGSVPPQIKLRFVIEVTTLDEEGIAHDVLDDTAVVRATEDAVKQATDLVGESLVPEEALATISA
jgi:hypothetical protein